MLPQRGLLNQNTSSFVVVVAISIIANASTKSALDSFEFIPVAKELVTCDEEIPRGVIADEVAAAAAVHVVVVVVGVVVGAVVGVVAPTAVLYF